MGISHDRKQCSLLNESFTFLNAELNEKHLMDCTCSESMVLPPQRSEMKEEGYVPHQFLYNNCQGSVLVPKAAPEWQSEPPLLDYSPGCNTVW
jgi:hypothetical protein